MSKDQNLYYGVGLIDRIMSCLKWVHRFFEHQVALSRQTSNLTFFVPFLEDSTVTGYMKNIRNMVCGNVLIPLFTHN